MRRLLGKEEVRRLQKAARDGNKNKLAEWIEQTENYLCEEYRKEYEKLVQEETQQTINNFLAALVYTLAFTEELEITFDQVKGVLDDLYSTVDMYKRGEYKPQEYLDKLKEAGLNFEFYDMSKFYKEKEEKLDNLITEYESKIKKLDKDNLISL